MEFCMDKIILSQIQVKTIIGVLNWERKLKQKLLIDLEVSLDLSKAGQSDDLNDSVDYAKIAARCVEIATQGQFFLLEALAEAVAKALLQEFKLKTVLIKVTKPEIIPGCKSVSIVIERS